MVAELEDVYILLHEEEALVTAGHAAGSGKLWCRPRTAADRGRHRGRSAGHPRGQRAARRPQGRGRQAPGFGDRREGLCWKAIAITMSGGEVISEDLGIKLENVTLDMLGRASVREDVEEGKHHDRRQVRGCKKADIEGRIGQIKAQIEETTSDYDKEKLQERLAKLGVAVIKVERFDRNRSEGAQGPR